MITKKIKKDIRNEMFGWITLWWAMIMVVVWLIVPSLDYTSYIGILMIGSFVVLFLLWVVAYFVSLHAYKKVMKRLDESINTESFQTINRFSISQHWCVYHKGNNYFPFYKDKVQGIYFDGKQVLISEKDRNGVYAIRCDAQTNQVLQDWYHLI